jgi:PAS domain S-box-containing protein
MTAKEKIQNNTTLTPALKDNEQRYHGIFEASTDAILIYNKEGRIVDANNKACNLYGYTLEEILQLTGKNVIHPDHHDRFEEFINAFTVDSTFCKESTDIRKDGTPFDVEVKGAAFNYQGNPHLVVFIKDITRRKENAAQLDQYRKKLEDLVKERESYLDTLLHFSENLKLTTDLPTLYRRITQMAKEVLRLDFSTLMLLTKDKKYLIIRDALGFPDTMIGTFALLEGQGLSTYVVLNKKPALVEDFLNETRFEVPPVVFEKNITSALCVPMMLEKEVFGVLIGHTHARRKFKKDETALYQSLGNQAAIAVKNIMHLHSLQKSENKFRTIFDNASDAIFISDMEGKILEANQIACDNLGYSREELLSRTIADIVAPDFQEGLPERRKKIADEGRAIIETRHVRKDGSVIPIELHGKLIRFNEQPAILSVARDISERKQMESYLFHAQKMEAIGTLAGGVAHDFNNILYAIMGYAEISMLDIPEYSPLQRNLEEIVKATKRAADLVKQILSFSRKVEHKREPLDLQPIIKETLKLLRGTLPTTIEIKKQLDPQCCAVVGDATQIHQILMNLCTNAFHAMRDKGGILTVGLEEIHITSHDKAFPELTPGSYAKISIKDTGTGMDEKTIDRIFDPYFTTKEFGEGTGLGLATVHGIVKSHGGIITVKSAPGEGTEFNVYFKTIHHAPVSADALSIGALPSLKGRVLFVDDEPMIKAVGETTLKQFGCEVSAFTNSLEALDTFQADPKSFDLVITDQTMPGLTGDELAMEILKLRPDIPIVLTTGYSDKINAKHAKQIGIMEFILKPLTLKTLADTAEKFLPKKQTEK